MSVAELIEMLRKVPQEAEIQFRPGAMIALLHVDARERVVVQVPLLIDVTSADG